MSIKPSSSLVVFTAFANSTCFKMFLIVCRRGRRRRDGGTFISDADDIINAMLTKMKEAAESDREANKKKQPALSKMKMLPTVIRHLKKQVCCHWFFLLKVLFSVKTIT